MAGLKVALDVKPSLALLLGRICELPIDNALLQTGLK